jgi:hypothetical protein
MNARRVLAVGLVAGAAAGLWGPGHRSAAADDQKPAASADAQWKALPEAEKNRIRENYREYMKMPPEERARLDKNYERYSKMLPAEKERVRKNWDKFKSLPPDKQKKVLEHAKSAHAADSGKKPPKAKRAEKNHRKK